MDVREAESLVAKHGSIRAAAKASGVPFATLQGRLKGVKDRSAPKMLETESLIFPDFPESELKPQEIAAQAAKNFAKHLAARDARRWMEIKVKSNRPIGVAFVGDPHLDNNGCNWPLLNRDIDVLANTPGMHAVNMGDLTDNWVGRLVRLYADQEMSKKQAWKLAAWFMNSAGISWMAHILGNHDAWNDGPYLIKANATPQVPVEDWQSRFKICFPNGNEVKVHAAHDFPGSSIWNDLHGAQKAAMQLEQADIYACAHKHSWAIKQGENAQRGFVYHLIRTRGYKFIDSYSDQLGFGSQQYGATITGIIDPAATGPTKIQMFADLVEAAKYLRHLRARDL